MKRIGIAADHGGFEFKQDLIYRMKNLGFPIVDYGAKEFDPTDDYPDFVIPLAQSVANGEVDLGIAVCSSGVGACIAANKVVSVRACLIHDYYSAHQGVEHDDMNLLCLGGDVIGQALAWDIVLAFINARFNGAERHRRRLAKIFAFEESETGRRAHHEQEPTYRP